MNFKNLLKFHGHTCFGLAVGYRVAMMALENLKTKKAEDEELVAIVENMSCAVDAVQFLTGCTLGKGNLYVKDYGKHVYTFAKRPSGDAIRIALRYESFSGIKNNDERMKKVLNARAEELFGVKKMKLKLPPVAEIVMPVKCSSCGGPVMKTRTKKFRGRTFCIPCYEKTKRH